MTRVVAELGRVDREDWADIGWSTWLLERRSSRWPIWSRPEAVPLERIVQRFDVVGVRGLEIIRADELLIGVVIGQQGASSFSSSAPRSTPSTSSAGSPSAPSARVRWAIYKQSQCNPAPRGTNHGLQRGFDRRGHDLRRPIAVNRPETRTARVELDQRFGLPLVHLQSLPHDLDHRRRRASPARRRTSRRRRPFGCRVRPALAADPARRQPAHQHRPPGPRCRAPPVARGPPPCRSSAVACTTVRGNPSSTNPHARIRSAQPITDDGDHHVVADQVAGLHRLPRGAAELGARSAPLRAGCRPSRFSAARASARAVPPACPCPHPAGRA